MNAKHRGAVSELKAQVYLLKEGYEVFANASSHGVFDLVVYNELTDKFTPIDVTTGTWYVKQDGTKSLQFATQKLTKNCAILVVVGEEFVWAKHPDEII